MNLNGASVLSNSIFTKQELSTELTKVPSVIWWLRLIVKTIYNDSLHNKTITVESTSIQGFDSVSLD